jgi:hypothetical protein
MDALVAEVVRRRKNAINVFLLIEKLRRRKNVTKPARLWSCSWLLRRDKHQSVLNMVFEELGYVNITCFIWLILSKHYNTQCCIVFALMKS